MLHREDEYNVWGKAPRYRIGTDKPSADEKAGGMEEEERSFSHQVQYRKRGFQKEMCNAFNFPPASPHFRLPLSGSIDPPERLPYGWPTEPTRRKDRRAD